MFLGLFLSVGFPGPAKGLVRLDFEMRYFAHPLQQVWDFSIVRPDSVYHIFYCSIPEANPHAANADTIWHATSPDLKHWDLAGPILAAGPENYDTGAMWAPDIFRDEAQDRWGIAYTGCDEGIVQRVCMAYSPDLFNWTKSPYNPTIEPDTSQYSWDPDIIWSDFRDPFLYRQDNQWHVLVTVKKILDGVTGVLYHGTSSDLKNWLDVGYFFANDGEEPNNVLESPQYHVIGDYHHLLFGEFSTHGITLLSAQQPGDWTMANRVLLDYGNAPEIDQFDTGHYIFSRIVPYLGFNDDVLSYVVRLDTLRTDPDGANPSVYKPHPLDEDWAVRTGLANLGNPTFGDGPRFRNESPAGTVGNGYYGSQEYYQGPLSGRGSPGTTLGPGATGLLESHRFIVEGQRMFLLVGGGNYPATCYVALFSAADTSVIYSETGQGQELMTHREWDLTPYQGTECFIRIVDAETGPMGYINVDEIIEIDDEVAPEAPTNVSAAYQAQGVDLNWDPAPEEDFLLHRIYRASVPDFVVTPDNLLQEVTESGWTDTVSDPYELFYQVTTVDWVGNESPPSAPSVLSDVPVISRTVGGALAEAVPNPFNPTTVLEFEMGRPGPVTLRIYDAAGRLVTTLVDETLSAGLHHATWDGRDSTGRAMAAGVYLYRLEAGDFSQTRRMTLVK